jgi:hypothetical protein
MRPAEFAVVAVLAVLGAALWAIALVDVFQRQDREFPSGSTDERLMWTLIVLLTNAIGSAVYFAMVMRPYPRRRR